MGSGFKGRIMLNFRGKTANKYATRAIMNWLWHNLHKHRKQIFINIFLGISSVLLDFAFIWSTKLAIDVATGKSNDSLQFAASCLIGIILSQISIGFISRWVKALLGIKAQNKMQQDLFHRILQSEWSGMEKRHSGDILNRLERDVRDIVDLLTETFPSMFSVSVRLIGAFFFLYSMDPFLACICILVLPLFILLSKVYVRKMRSLTREIRNTDSRVQSLLQESVQHRMIIKTLEQNTTQVSKLEDIHATLRNQVKQRVCFSSFSQTILSMGFSSCYLITFLWGVSRLQEGEITYGMLMAFIQLVGQIQGPFREVTRFVPLVVSAFTASERLMELEDSSLEEKGLPIRFNTPAGIHINQVGYAYTPERKWVLKEFSFDFPPGSSTAILGETGTGKTTLIRLMLALMKPLEGELKLYGSEQEEMCSPLTRCNFIYVPQGNTLFSGTVRDNLLLGNPNATEEEMEQALQNACADFVLQLPERLDTRCSERGGGLSEGQAQRIAIARALLRKGGILLLDEATSALDSETEDMLLRNLTRQTKDKTLIFITHRKTVVEYCDQVLHLTPSN